MATHTKWIIIVSVYTLYIMLVIMFLRISPIYLTKAELLYSRQKKPHKISLIKPTQNAFLCSVGKTYTVRIYIYNCSASQKCGIFVAGCCCWACSDWIEYKLSTPLVILYYFNMPITKTTTCVCIWVVLLLLWETDLLSQASKFYL